jgi:hypothetical protein
MSVAEKTGRKRVFIASSRADLAEVQKAMQQLDLDAVTLDQAASPGSSWVDSLNQCVNDADIVIGIMTERQRDTNVFFELGVASALNKPTLLFVPRDYPVELIPPSGLPYLRLDLQDEDALRFGLQQVLALSPRPWSRPADHGFTTQPIGAIGDQLLARLPSATPQEFEDLIFEALKASGVPAIARGSESEYDGIGFAIWSGDLEPTITNPLLIECKARLQSRPEVNEAMGKMLLALNSIHNGCGIVLYRDAGKAVQEVARSLPVLLISAEDFLKGLRDIGLAKYVRALRNSSARGC